ncbi:MAG: N-acetyltransferase family protein [Thermoguttaceae bacterium]
MAIRFAQASEADATILARLNRQIHQTHVDHAPWFFAQPTVDEVQDAFAAMLRQGNTQGFVAYSDEITVGYILLVVRERAASIFCRASRSLSIEHIAAVPEWQRHGVGHRLIEAAEEYARVAGLGTIMAETWVFNHASQAFFESLGFQAQTVRYCMRILNVLRAESNVASS